MNLEQLEKELRMYGAIVNRIDWSEIHKNHTIKVYFFEGEYFMVKMVNGSISGIKEIQYTDYKVVGQDKVSKICCICGNEFIGYGNNPYPVTNKGVCCDGCNSTVVIPKRLEEMK